MFKGKKTQPKSIKNIIKKSVINFEERKKVAPKKERIMTPQLKQLYHIEAKKYFLSEHRNFDVDENNKRFLDIFCRYFASDTEFETKYKGELQKGLYVFGIPGTGKTSCFKIMQNVSKVYSISQVWMPIISTQNVVEQFNTSESNKKDFVIQNYSKGIFMFDDLGAEKEASNFGKEDIFERIMERRYDKFLEKGTKTFVTSNLSFEGIKKRYGSRLYDRFFQMFNVLELGGQSRRF